MLPSNPICPVCNYATSAVYCDLPSPEQLANGVKPLDSLPAAWWNNMWNMTNCSINQARGVVGSFITELNNVLAGAGICPNCVCTDQLYQAIDLIRQTIGNATVAGAVKSSSTPGMVSIDESGFMTANCLGNASQLTTTAHTLVGAVNELKSTYDACTSGLTTAVNSKAPINHASSAATYGVGTATNYGHLRISNTYTSDIGDAGAAASQSALYSVYNYATQISAAAIGLGNTAGCPLGTASAGSATTSARSDHVHPLQTHVSCADYLCGFGVSEGAYGSTIVVRNIYGYIYADYFNGGVHPEDLRGYSGCNLVFQSADGYYRTTPPSYVSVGNASVASRVETTVAAGTDATLIYATIADNDYFRLRAGGNSNGGWAALETADDATEPISVAQFTGVFATEVRRAYLLDPNGNTSFPGTVTATGGFSGNLSGTASNADTVDGFHAMGDLTCTLIRSYRGVSAGFANQGYWAAMSNGNIDGTDKWWHVLSMDWSGAEADPAGWVSQLLLPTNQGGIPKYRYNNPNTPITSSPWRNFITQDNIDSQSVNYANSARTAIWSDYTTISRLNSETDQPVYYYHSNGCTFVCANYPAFLGSTTNGCTLFLGRGTSKVLAASIIYPTNYYYMTSGD